jgi:formate C-acetyltransferase
MDRGLFQNYSAYGGGVSQVSAKCLDKGLNYVIKLAQDERERMMREGDTLDPRQIAENRGGTGNCHGTAQFLRKYWYLEAIIISCNAMIVFAKRHADLLREYADKEKDEARREELLKMADGCDRVPGEPPRNFLEAVQAARFMHLAAWKESSDRPEVPIGRMDQYLWKYYEQDKLKGDIDAQQAAEILGAFWLKIRECENLVTIPREQRAAPGSLLPNVTLCGTDVNGVDLTNELSWIVLEVMSQIKLSEPAVYVRYNPDMDPEFVKHALECNREFGGGNPAFLSDRMGTKRYLDLGVPIEDAVNWNASGCLGYHLDCMEHMGGGYNLCQPKVLEVALNNGVDPRTGIDLGLHTGDLREAKTFDEVKEAFYEQERYFAPKLMRFKTLGWGTEIVDGPMSGLRGAMQYEDCIPSGLASREGGARYPQGRASWFGSRGMVDLADTLAAIKKLVFDDKVVSMGELLDACAANWVGYEELQQKCIAVPKYGNDDDYVDEIYDELSKKVPEIMMAIKDPLTGETPMLFIGAAAGHTTIGKAIGALPNGRNAGVPVDDAACSVMPGMDTNGPTAAINSATRDNYSQPYAGFAMNMKFSKAVLNSDEKLAKLATLIKAFNKRDGWHVQFNIHSKEELLDAKEHPENHKNLLVRVGGYSAYFIDLPPELQSEIVNRTMHEFM